MKDTLTLNGAVVKQASQYAASHNFNLLHLVENYLISLTLTEEPPAIPAVSLKKDLRDLRGKIEFSSGYDYKQMRATQ
jgi:hypothetical protein